MENQQEQNMTIDTSTIITDPTRPLQFEQAPQKIDRMNKDVKPPPKEGYEYKFGKNGWRAQKITTTEQKQAKGQQLRQAKQLIQQIEPQPQQNEAISLKQTVEDLKQQLKLLAEQPQQQPISKPEPVQIVKTKKIRQVEVIDKNMNPTLQKLGIAKKTIYEEYSE
ncbi:Hypothetical_protein [Hexamita inflata]|uniref:Hypothetical_protein n=1 Tax=Hexamita inflata TaxID=28002 RepID=A0AA86PWP6_9EUKA|nr:Hypothetical protein HINF_LOCUS35420 [Hexamita inflata]